MLPPETEIAVLLGLFFLALILIIGAGLFNNKLDLEKMDKIYSTGNFVIVNVDEKSREIADWVHSFCPKEDYSRIYNQIKHQLEESNQL